MKKGKLIVLEGIDGAGTSTQLKLLSEFLLNSGYEVKTSHEPTAFVVGKEIRNILAASAPKSQEEYARFALMFAADRMDHVCKVIEPSLKNHDFLLLDRYVMSSLVYQGMSQPTSWIMEINKFALKPDLTIVMDLPAKKACKRLDERASTKDFFEEESFLEKLRERYLHFAKIDSANCVIVDSSSSKEDVFSHISHVIRERFFR